MNGTVFHSFVLIMKRRDCRFLRLFLFNFKRYYFVIRPILTIYILIESLYFAVFKYIKIL